MISHACLFSVLYSLKSFHILADQETSQQHFACCLLRTFLLHYIVTRIYKQREIICMKISKFDQKKTLLYIYEFKDTQRLYKINQIILI